ncbi:MAG TPA: hypothetical protein VMS08_04235 [Candidatus Saccharimonadia bacterium]|nr:hypothetical protein [Candidatus Saccharimonadia bacterium]
MKSKPNVVIPRSELAGQLAEAAHIKRQMTQLLIELEQKVSAHSDEKPGGWRQDPKAWLARVKH